MNPKKLRLGVNIDHVATIRNARGEPHPDPVEAARIAAEAGADGITAHLREDRRHIRDDDIHRIKDTITLPLNMEMAPTEDMLAIACDVRPHAACIVPERREEITTEGGLDVITHQDTLSPIVTALKNAGIRVSLFVEADPAQLDVAKHIAADIVELHTGAYANTSGGTHAEELQRLQQAAAHASAIGLECHAGHGLKYNNVGPIAAIPDIVELNIGHFLIGQAIFTGLAASISEMRRFMDTARI